MVLPVVWAGNVRITAVVKNIAIIRVDQMARAVLPNVDLFMFFFLLVD